MHSVVISGTGLYQPPHVITNAELVEAFNRYVDLQNAEHAEAMPRIGLRVDPRLERRDLA